MKYQVDFSGSIASSKEAKVLNKPFKTPNGQAAYAVYVKNDKSQIVRVDFNACRASDATNIGPKWTSEHWGSQVNSAKAAESKATTLNQMSDFYYEKPVNPSRDENWDGYTFYSQEEIISSLPSLKFAPSSFTQNVATSKTAKPADTEFNSDVKKQLDTAAAK